MKNILFTFFVGVVFVILVQANEKYDARPQLLQIQPASATQKANKYMIEFWVKRCTDGRYVVVNEDTEYAIQVCLKIKSIKPGTKSITVEIQDR